MLNTQKNKQAICIWDMSIDFDNTDLSAYLTSRDLSKVAFMPGAKPEVYHIRPLTHDVCAWVCSAPEGPERQARAFFACVVRVDNLRIEDGNGAVIREYDEWAPTITRERSDRLASTFDLFSKDEKELFPAATVYEIGEVAWGYSFFPKKIAPRFVLPRTSVQILEAVFQHRAERATNILAGGPTEPTQQSQEAEAPKPSTSDAKSGEPGNATATA